MNQKGISTTVTILIIVGVLITAGGIYWWQKSNESQKFTDPYYNNLYLKCKDSCCRESVERMAAGNFKLPEPGKNCSDNFQPNTLKCESSYKWCEPKDETADWQTYRNESYQLFFKYPPNWSIELIENQSYPLTFQGDRQGIIIAQPNQGGEKARNYLNNIFVSYREITEPFEEYIRPEFCDIGECSPVELDLQEEVVIDGRKGVLQVGDLGIAGKQIQSFIQMGGSRVLVIYSGMGDPDQNLENLEARNEIQTFRAILNSIKFLE